MPLRPYQRPAVSALVTELTTEERATLVSACGTGKTWMAGAVADRIAGNGVVLVLVPTLDLIAQTIKTWRARGYSGAVVAACSDLELAATAKEVRGVTTAPAELALLVAKQQPVTVVGTYASLPVIIEAHRSYDLPRWDLAIIDEAHSTSGDLGRPWSAVHDQAALPAARRLYMTATPRIIDETGRPVASMDDPAVYGKVAYRLGMGEAIGAGILADYRVVVLVVSDDHNRELIATASTVESGGSAVAADDLAMALAVLRAAGEYGMSRITTFHSRVARARGFARAIETAAALLPESERPENLWAAACWGKMPVSARRQRLERFATGDGVHVLANSRLLGAGIDVPDMDGILFGDPKTSTIDIVQAVGRALRKGSNLDKTATIVIPLVAPDDQSLESAMIASAWAPLWKTLRALRAHDDRLGERVRTQNSGSRKGNEDGGGNGPDLSWIHIKGADLPADFATALELRLLENRTAEFARGLAAARRHHANTGTINVKQSFVDDRGFALGAWLSWCRYMYATQSLSQIRIKALEDLGIIWSPRETAFDKGYQAARSYAEEHGHLAIATTEIHEGFKLGAWLNNRRHRSDEPEKDRLLAELDPLWNAPFPPQWRRAYYRAKAWIADNGTADIPRRTRVDGYTLGEWWFRQLQDWQKLAPQQQELLAGLGADPDSGRPHDVAFEKGLDAATKFFNTFGHLEVHVTYVDPDTGYRLGDWIARQRSKNADRMPEERRAALDTIGMRWLNRQGPAASPGFSHGPMRQ